MTRLKELLKKAKSVKKSDEILDELFSSIKEEDRATESEVTTGDSDGGSESDSAEESKKKIKKKKKKHKKHKKKKKKHKRSDHSEERSEEDSSSKVRKEGDGFWSKGKAFEKELERTSSRRSHKRSKGDEEEVYEDWDSYRKGEKEKGSRKEYYGDRDRDDRDRVKRESSRSYKSDNSYRRENYKKEVVYDDERRPVNLGRVALPYRVDDEGLPLPEREKSQRHYSGHEPRETVYQGDEQREMYDRERVSRQEYHREERGGHRDDKRGHDDSRVGFSGRDEWGPYTGKAERERPDRSRRGAYDRGKEEVVPKRTHEKRKKDVEGGEEKDVEGGEEKDGFWDTKWDAMQLTEKIEKAEKKGRYYLNTKKRFKDATGDIDGSPSLSPSPERAGKKKKKYSDSESDTEELKIMKKLKDIHDLKVDGDGLVEGAPVDASNYEYDKVTKMYRKKDGLVNLEKKKYDKKFGNSEKKNEEKEEKKEDVKAESEDELVKDIEDLEKEAERTDDKPSSKEAGKTEDKPSIDWGDSALAHLKDEQHAENLKKSDELIESLLKQKKKKDKKAKKEKDDSDSLEEGEVNEGKEDGEVEDSDEGKKKSSRRSRSKSRGRHRSSSYSRDKRSKSGHRSSYSRRDDRKDRDERRSPYDRRERDNYRRGQYQRERDDRGYRGSYGRDRDSYGHRSRYRSRSRSKSRERYREPDRYELNKQRQEKHLRSKINKEKLLEIAKKNAAKILKSGGDLMGMDQDRLIAMKSGGQNLDELTKFCKELAKKGLEDKNRIELLAESESEEEEFHHPFMVKDRPLPNPISMLIGEPRETLPPVARAVAKSQRMLEFPVSSGNAHRVKEVTVDPLGDWKPVEKDERKALTMEVDEDEMLKMHEEIEAEDAALAKEADENKDEEEKAWKLTEAEKANIINPLGVVMFGGVKELPEEKKEEVEKLKPATSSTPLALPAPKERLALPAPSSSGTSAGTLVQHKLSENPDKVFDTAEGPVVDIGTIISNRLNAMRKLQDTPNDAEALQEMYNAQKQMANWATSKNKPGQFVGSTGARILSHHELNLGLQCWARKDQFTNAAKVSGGFGEFILKKMGWSDGDGLGKHRNGTVDPLILDIKFDKKGLMAEEENRRGKVVTMTGCKDLSSKHPVSALMELCSKRRWGPPTFEQAFECGPPHKKQYVFKVIVDGKEYMPTVAVDNKKKAKSNSAMACLQQMGLLAKDPDNPV